MRVRVLGEFAVEGVTERDLGSKKGRTLLKVLVLARSKPVAVDRLADILWGDAPPARPAEQVGVLVSRLRGVLGADRLPRTDAGYALVVDWLDADELVELTAAAAQALDDGRLGAARAAAAAALALDRGPLLPDEEGEWVEGDRAALAATLGRSRRIAIDAAVAAGDPGAAAALAEVALADDPYDEVVLRALMRSHLAAGRPASALAAYARARARLAEDLGVSPTAETDALHSAALMAADDTPAPDGGEPAAALAPMAASAPRLVGRDAELEVLGRALQAVSNGGAAELVVVEGEAGIGKTTLVDAWARAVGGRAVVLRGRCDELGRDLPLQPVADAVADHLGGLGQEQSAGLVGDEAGVLAPVLGPLTGVSATVVTDVEVAQARIFAALASVVVRLGAGRPLLLVVEDLHLAGATTKAWFGYARRRCQGTVLVVTTRPGGARGLDATEHLVLGPLTREAVAGWVGDRADELYDRSGGHPLLLAALIDAGDDELPATLSEALSRQVESLGEEVAATLRSAAVLGAECDLDLVAAVTGTPSVDVLGHLEAAASAGLVVERGERFVFRHELVRQALDGATGAARRALVHQRAAHVLAGRPNGDPLAVAIHARAGGDRALASSAFVTAAGLAAGRFDLDAAEEHLAAAIDLDPVPEAYAARARIRMSRADFGDAAVDAAQAIAAGGGAPALEVAGWVAYYRRHYGDARAYADEAARLTSDEGVKLSALALAARVRHAEGDMDGAVERLSGVAKAPPAVRGVADVWLAQVRVHQGRPEEALAALTRPMVDPDSLAHPWAPLHLRFNRIMALGQLGRVGEALRVVDDLDAAVARGGVVGARFRAPAANIGAWILRWSGRWAEADERNWHAVEITGGDDGPTADAFAEGHYVALLDLADGCLLRGEDTEAARLAERLARLDGWGGTMAWHQRHRLGLLRARLALTGGDTETAAGLATAVADDAGARGASRYEALGRVVAARADPAIPLDSLDGAIVALQRCAVIDGWKPLAALADARGSDRLRAVAENLAGALEA